MRLSSMAVAVISAEVRSKDECHFFIVQQPYRHLVCWARCGVYDRPGSNVSGLPLRNTAILDDPHELSRLEVHHQVEKAVAQIRVILPSVFSELGDGRDEVPAQLEWLSVGCCAVTR